MSEADGLHRLEPMNLIGWIVGHMAWHEQRHWLTSLADVTPEPILNEVAAGGGPMTTPSVKAMLKSWKVFGIRSTISAQALSLEVRGCGGAIDVAVITRRDRLRFIQRKVLSGDQPMMSPVSRDG